MKFWVDEAPGNPSENRSLAGEEAPRVSPRAGRLPFPNLNARDIRTPTSPERRERPLPDKGTMGKGVLILVVKTSRQTSVLGSPRGLRLEDGFYSHAAQEV